MKLCRRKVSEFLKFIIMQENFCSLLLTRTRTTLILITYTLALKMALITLIKLVEKTFTVYPLSRITVSNYKAGKCSVVIHPQLAKIHENCESFNPQMFYCIRCNAKCYCLIYQWLCSNYSSFSSYN